MKNVNIHIVQGGDIAGIILGGYNRWQHINGVFTKVAT